MTRERSIVRNENVNNTEWPVSFKATGNIDFFESFSVDGVEFLPSDIKNAAGCQQR